MQGVLGAVGKGGLNMLCRRSSVGSSELKASFCTGSGYLADGALGPFTPVVREGAVRLVRSVAVVKIGPKCRREAAGRSCWLMCS